LTEETSFWQGATRVRAPLQGAVAGLTAGTRVLLSGVVYTARDAAHKRIVEALEKGSQLPFDLVGQVIYYAGPCPPAPGQVIGSLGPTTSGRMDPYAPRLISAGLRGMIGKGRRNREVVDALSRYQAVYFVTIGGAGALLQRTVRKADLVAYPDLGPEAVYRLEIEDFPAIVGIDAFGNDIYERGNSH
jgi:fumarate hydratase subunit beta